MIVICTKCKAKFRVADEKIGVRGAKVRCSKCQTVFRVEPEAASAAAAGGIGIELEPARWDPTQPDLGSAPASARDPFAPSAPGDPFAPSPPGDPFAPAAQPDPFAPAGRDPFAPAGLAPAAASSDPFAPPAFAPAEPGAARALATDLAALLGAAPPPPSPPPLPAPPPLPRPSAAEPDAAPAADADAIALEDRPDTPPRPASSAPFDLGAEAGYDPFPGGIDAEPFDPGALDLAGPAADAAPAPGFASASLELAGPTQAAAAPAARAPAPAAPAPASPRGADAPAAPDAAAHAHERIPGRPSRLRALAVNAVALAALLVAAAAILTLWRTEGPIEPRALRPSAVVAALRRGGGDARFAAREVRSGLYEREKAPPVLFVRGTVVSRATEPVARVRVRVDVVRGGVAVASGEAIAGAVPTPEELWGAQDAAALDAAATGARARAPAVVRPGDAVPFLVAIGDAPADLSGTSLRVVAGPAGGGPP